MTVIETLKAGRLVLDGGFGTYLREQGYEGASEEANLDCPDLVASIHAAYFRAGSDAVSANTFGINPLRHDKETCKKMLKSAFGCAKRVRPEGKFVFLDLGPTGKLLEPYGDLTFEEAYESFLFVVNESLPYAPDAVFIETMNDSYETKAAVLAAKTAGLPVLVGNVYDASAKLMTGADIPAMVALLEGLRVDAFGLNCSLGPEQMLDLVSAFSEYSSTPIIVKPNAGLPREEGGRAVYDVGAKEFASLMAEAVKRGATVIGGCCGTTPEFIRAMAEQTADLPFALPKKKDKTLVSSYTHALEIGKNPLLVGERINPTGKKRFKQALREKDLAYLLNEGTDQQDKGAHILDVNVGLPEIDEAAMMERVVKELQAVSDLPLQIDTVHPVAMEKGLRYYNGKPLVNSVDGKQESMDRVFPLVQKYGGTVICLTMDEAGIPATAEGRVEVAKRIVNEAAKYGIEPKDLVFDPLTLTVSSDPNAGRVTLEALTKIKRELNGKTSLGVSNISFGLPQRELLNGAFFLLALEHGLDLAIVNPFSDEMHKAYRTYLALTGKDNRFEEYLSYVERRTPDVPQTSVPSPSSPLSEAGSPLERAIVRGLREQAREEAKELLKAEQPLRIIDAYVIPALNRVGKGFEEKKVYLPQLLMSADAAKEAFAVIKEAIPPSEGTDKIVLATVKGDIHDIGKNIVRVLLENFGFTVIDLGKDVSPERVAEETVRHNCRLVGLSALMTTTVPAMAETIALLRQKAPFAKVVVGGAVLTQEYADMIGADKYAADAMETVRYAQEVFG
ncbi:MAG: homocysteine S-methyltransferase family protein [Clostridia bacterium]|nr:homocysteine S-methyltransferase family protein [Clostridia bacterium]